MGGGSFWGEDGRGVRFGFGLRVGIGPEGRTLLHNFGPFLLVGFEEFLLREFVDLDHELGEIAESQGGLGLRVALCGGGKDGANSVADIRGGKDIGGDELADLASGFLGFEVGAVFLAVVVTETEVVGELREIAAAAVSVSEMT